MLEDWCTTCNTRHSGKETCPGVLSPTGTERSGWKVSVKTNRGPESYVVVVSPSGRQWLARILTFPDEFWTVPGTRHHKNFLGNNPQVAERKAVEHIKEHIRSRNLTVLGSRSAAAPRKNSTAGKRPPRGPDRNGPPDYDEVGDPEVLRKQCSIPVMFGHNTHSRKAAVENVSERGMFIRTTDPLRPGSVIRIKMELDTCTMPLRGMVVWTRIGREEGRSSGMGIRLFKPPALYISYVQMI